MVQLDLIVQRKRADVEKWMGEDTPFPKREAFEWLSKACDERDPLVIWLKVDFMLDNLRADPRFAQTLKDMGLPP